jgi:hypothetical protein
MILPNIMLLTCAWGLWHGAIGSSGMEWVNQGWYESKKDCHFASDDGLILIWPEEHRDGDMLALKLVDTQGREVERKCLPQGVKPWE